MNMGTLYVIATPIGNLEEMTPRAIRILNSVDLIACEDTRVTVKLLTHFKINKPLMAYHEHNEFVASYKVIDALIMGQNVALVSDAGYPGISDPGLLVIQKAIEKDVKIEVISGPCAIINALVGSGLETDRFYFHGFLKNKSGDRRKELTKIAQKEETLIFYESPHRLFETVVDLKAIFGGDRRAAICRELTKLHEEFMRDTLENLSLLSLEDIKGEIVIVVEGNKTLERPTLSTNEIIKEVDLRIDKGMSAKDAIKDVAKTHDISKNDIYRLFHNENVNN